jgi:SAM-dependent methyltransferase
LDLPGHPIPFRLWRCRGCGVVFNHPRLSADQIRDQYDGEYYVFKESPARRWGRATQLYVEHLLPMEARLGRGRLVEIGCAGGEVLALARYRGWQTLGIEISPEAAASARRDRGVEVLSGTLEEHAGGVGVFDLAIANDVIEHVPSSRAFLQSLHRIVRPGGWASIETPNWGSVWRRLGGAKWLGINRFHILLFDAGSLTRLMSDCGFTECTAGSSTNLAYTSWAGRPEITRAIGCLPAGLRWRAQQWADRLTPSCFALQLHRNPPLNLKQALARIAAADSGQPGLPEGLWGDNLTVIGRA